MNEAPLPSWMSASSLSGICWPVGVPTSRFADLLGVLAELRLHAYDEVKKLFALDHLRGGLSPDGGLHDGFNVRHVHAVAGDPVAIHLHDQSWLAEFAHHSQLGEPGHLLEAALNF